MVTCMWDSKAVSHCCFVVFRQHHSFVVFVVFRLYQAGTRRPLVFSPSTELGLTDIEMAHTLDYDDPYFDEREGYDIEYEVRCATQHSVCTDQCVTQHSVCTDQCAIQHSVCTDHCAIQHSVCYTAQCVHRPVCYTAQCVHRSVCYTAQCVHRTVLYSKVYAQTISMIN